MSDFFDDEEYSSPQRTNRPTNRKRKKKKKRKSFFKKGLLIYIAILALASLSVLIYLWVSLSKYQNRIDEENKQAEYALSVERAPQIFFEKYVSGMTISDWVNVWYETYPEHFDSEETVSTYISSLLSGTELTRWKAPEYTKENPVYLVKSGEEAMAKFYLSGSELDWNITKSEMMVSGSQTVSFSVPSACDAFCNGVAISDGYITENDNTLTVEGYEDSLNNPVSYKTYTLDCLLAEPEITSSINSEDFSTAVDSHNDSYLTLKSASADEYKAKAETFIKALLNYFNSGSQNTAGNMNAALSHVASGSKASSIIKQSYDGITWKAASSCKYETSLSDVYVLADNAYCVDVTYKDMNAENPDETKEIYRVYILDLGKGYKIYNFGLY